MNELGLRVNNNEGEEKGPWQPVTQLPTSWLPTGCDYPPPSPATMPLPPWGTVFLLKPWNK